MKSEDESYRHYFRLYMLYDSLIILWNNSKVEYLKKHFQSQEPEVFPLFLESMYKPLKACFHKKTLQAFPKKNITELVYDPNVFVFDSLQIWESLNKDFLKICKRHQNIVENHARLLFLAKQYMKEVEKSRYGAAIVDFNLHPERAEGWRKFVVKILNSDLIKKKAAEVNSLLPGEQYSIANQAIARFLIKRKNKALPLGEYLPPSLSESVWGPFRQILNEYGDMEKAQALRDAVARKDGVGCLEREVFSALSNFFKAENRQKRGGGIRNESLQGFNFYQSDEEGPRETILPFNLRDNSYRFNRALFSKKDLNFIQKAAELDGENITKTEMANLLGIDRKTLRARIKKLYNICDLDISKDAFEK